ncbi:hypothetical protein [Neisseria polysaccharea]|nr:hypothetical protein [Neisseria polysaccharea]
MPSEAHCPSFPSRQLRRVGFSPPFFLFLLVDWWAEVHPTVAEFSDNL